MNLTELYSLFDKALDILMQKNGLKVVKKMITQAL